MQNNVLFDLERVSFKSLVSLSNENFSFIYKCIFSLGQRNKGIKKQQQKLIIKYNKKVKNV